MNALASTNRRLRVALVTNRFLPQVGGAEINIGHQARYLARHVDLTVFCPRRVAAPAAAVQNGYRIRRLDDWLNRRRVYPNNRSDTFCPALFFRILAGRFDLLQCFPAFNRNNLLAALAARLAGTKIIFCFFDYLDYAKIIKSTGRIDPGMIDAHVPNAKIRWLLRRIDQAYAISNREVAFLRRYVGHVEFSPVPILVDEYLGDVPSPRARHGIPESDFVFLCLNRISVVKGQDLALEAFLRVAGALPGSRLVFVGNTQAEPELTARMEARIAASGLRDRILFTGLVERPELLGWLRHADIQVIPARFMNAGAVVVESWASGTPVIQSDAVDPNLVREGENGFGFPRQDVAALAAKMELAYRQRERLPALGVASREMVRDKYTYEALTRQYLAAYSRLTGHRFG
ncbi:MAG: glycosyltransferase family 4 protein [Lentisphaeria bacterium]